MADGYENYWNIIFSDIKKKNKFELNDIFDINFNKEIINVEKVIYKGEIIHINNIRTEKEKYFNLSRQYTLNEKNINNYDLIIELGSGWGRNIFYYINKYNLKNTKIISGEYADSGCNAQKFIKNKFFNEHDLDIYNFDYNNSDSFFENIKGKYNNVLVMTFWSIEQVTNLNDNFFNNLLNINAKIKCVHIEPIGWQISNKSLMKENINGPRNYYNKNLYKKLTELEKSNKISINKNILDFFNFGCVESCGTLVEWDKT